MKICVIGAPSTGKSVFARQLAAEITRQGRSCDLVQEYATSYIQQVSAPRYPWEQLIISMGQHMSENVSKRDHVVTDAAAFATFIYAERLIPEVVDDTDWPRYRNLIDMLRILARQSVLSYDLIFFMTHIFNPRSDNVRLDAHLNKDACEDIGQSLELYLKSERVEYHRLQANDTKALDKAMQIIEQRIMIAAEPSTKT